MNAACLIAAALLLPQGGSKNAVPNAGTPVVLRVGAVLIGDGRRLGPTRIRIEGGKIRSLEPDEGPPPRGVRLVDRRTATVLPGLIAAYSELATADDEYNVTPERRAVDQFDFAADRRRLLRSGLTAVYLNPGRNRLIPGQGSVVKLAGRDPEHRILKRAADLHVNLDAASRRNVPAVFEPVPAPTSEDPLRPARRQRGSSLVGQVRLLDALFAAAKEGTPPPERGGPYGYTPDLEPLRRALSGNLTVRFSVRTTAEILRALSLARRWGLRIALEFPEQAADAAALLAEQSIPVILDLPLNPDRRNPGDLLEAPERRGLEPDTPAVLQRRGVPVALAPRRSDGLENLRLLMGLAARYGLPSDKALAAVTLEAARVLGVEDRVGSVEPGKDADLLLLSGSPFDLRSRVREVWIDGEPVYEAPKPEPVYAIQAGRVLVGDGRELADATVLVRSGRIVEVGPKIPVPGGAKRFGSPSAVLVPGFIAADSRLGLHADPGAKLAAGPATDTAGALDPADPVFAPVLAAGVTAVFVGPDAAGEVGGRIAAVRPGGPDGFSIRPLAGLRLKLRGGAAAKARIAAILKKARAYCFPAKKKAPASKPAKGAAAEKPEKRPDPVTGLWRGRVKGAPVPMPLTFELELELLDGSKVEGVLRSRLLRGREFELEGSFADGALSLNLEVQGQEIHVQGRIENDVCSGRIEGAPFPMTFRMRRVEAPDESAAGATGSAETTKAGARAKDEKLEPFRPVLEKKIPLVCEVADRATAQAAVDAIARDAGLRLVLTGAAREIAEKPLDLPAGRTIGFLLAPEEVGYEEKGVWKDVAGKIAASGLKLCLVARAQLGTRYLPAHAAWAVARGLDPRIALAAVTANPAACFGLDRRIGRIEPGLEADLVLLSGDPFDLSTRILTVFRRGQPAVPAPKEER